MLSLSSLDILFVCFAPCDKKVTTSNLFNLNLFKRYTECDSFSENIATRMFIGLTTPFPDD